MNWYTDGAYSSIHKQGGWAFYCPELNLKVTNSVKFGATNNRMELIAVLATLQYIILSKLTDEIIINSDSMYVIGCASLGWGRKENSDLWQCFDNYINRISSHIVFKHVKGHSDCVENNIVDLLANVSSNICTT